MIAVFDEDGACLVVTDCPDPLDERKTAEVPRGTKPGQVWWDGSEVQTSVPTELTLPVSLDMGGPVVTIDLPEGAVADVNGVRQKGQITLDPAEVGTLHVTLRGALCGSYTVAVSTYVERRKAEYPPIGEQLDVLWKALAEAPPEVPEVMAMLDQIEAVKAANPKPD